MEMRPDRETISVTSLEVAEYFDKRHARVMHAIRRIQVSVQLPLFIQKTRFIEAGKGARVEHPYFEITPDGFSILAMGFTGKKALARKIPLANVPNWPAAALSAILSGRPASADDPALLAASASGEFSQKVEA